MPNILDILARAQSLMNETALNSITPPRAGGIMYDTLLVLNQMQLEGGSLLISKIYTSVSAMEADTTPTSDLTGRALRAGQLVVIVPSDTSSADLGKVYRYNAPGSWSYTSKIGGLPLDTAPAQGSTNGITSGAVYDVKQTIDGNVGLLDNKVSGIALKDQMIDPLFVSGRAITDFSEFTKQNYVILSGGAYGSASSSKHIELPVKEGQRVHLKAHATNGTRYAFFWDYDSPASGAVTPYVETNGEIAPFIEAGQEAIIDVPAGAIVLIVNVGSTTTPYTPQSLTIYGSTLEDAEEQLMDTKVYECANLEDPNKLKANWAIDSRNGRILRQSNSSTGITDYIPVKGGNLYCNNRTTSGNYGRSAVYDSNKVFIRTFNTDEYTYVEGDAFVRYTVSLSSTQKVITRKTFSIPRPMAYDGALEQTEVNLPDFTIKKSQAPDVFPSSGLVGEPGKTVTAASLANDSITIADAPKKLKPNSSLSFYGKISSFGFIELGGGRLNNTGWGLRVTSDNVSAVAYNNSSPVLVDTKAHGLTIGTFIYVSMVRNGLTIDVKITSFGGSYVGTVSLNNIETYGTPFAYADADTALTDVKFGWVSKDLRKAIWFFGASYCSLYTKRMLTQLRDTYGVDSFAIIAQAGDDFEDIMPSVEAALNFGTPKFLVCAVGMNTAYPAVYFYYLSKLQNICRSRGIILILCTIPWPENGTKSGINDIVKESGERYIDLYAAVSSDDNGTWYEGYCDDGVHPTVVGAKAMAARIMLDLPEILQY